VTGSIDFVIDEEIRLQLEKMNVGKAAGPDEFLIEIVKKMGNIEVGWMAAVMREVQRKGIPRAWRKSRTTPLYKQKGNTLNCANCREVVDILKRQYMDSKKGNPAHVLSMDAIRKDVRTSAVPTPSVRRSRESL